jgi:hypothetical protein
MKTLKQLARLKGIQLPGIKSPSDDEVDEEEEEEQEHVPGYLTGNLHREFFAAMAAFHFRLITFHVGALRAAPSSKLRFAHLF